MPGTAAVVSVIDELPEPHERHGLSRAAETMLFDRL